jgi:putative salt-induced outer membrane protein
LYLTIEAAALLMTFRKLILFLLAPLLMADQIALQNGDRITGKIVKKDASTLTFKSDVFGTISVPWKEVRTVTTDAPVFVGLPGDKTVVGRIETEEGRVHVATAPDNREESPLADLRFIRDTNEQRAYERLLEPSWTELWAGTATFGLAGARGNADTSTFSIGMNAARVTSKDKATAQFNMIRSSALLEGESATTAQLVRGSWGYSHTLSSRFTWNTFNDYEYDRFQNLDLRFVLGGGAGFIVWKGERSRFDLLSGGAYNHESFSEAAPEAEFSRNSGEGYAGNEFTFKLSPVTSLFQNARFFSNLSDMGEYRFNFDIGANTKLTRWLTWNGTVSNRYLSNPVPGRKQSDFLYTTGLGVTFSH